MADLIDAEAILASSIFKKDEQDRWFLKGFKPGQGKVLSDKFKCRRDIKPHHLKLMAAEISGHIKRYLSDPGIDTFTDWENDLENGIAELLKTKFGLETNELEPEFCKFIKKCKKMLRSKTLALESGEKIKLEHISDEWNNFDSKKNLRRASLVNSIQGSFDEYVKAGVTDTYYYIAYILIDLKIENGSLKQVFDRLFKARDRSM